MLMVLPCSVSTECVCAWRMAVVMGSGGQLVANAALLVCMFVNLCGMCAVHAEQLMWCAAAAAWLNK